MPLNMDWLENVPPGEIVQQTVFVHSKDSVRIFMHRTVKPDHVEHYNGDRDARMKSGYRPELSWSSYKCPANHKSHAFIRGNPYAPRN